MPLHRLGNNQPEQFNVEPRRTEREEAPASDTHVRTLFCQMALVFHIEKLRWKKYRGKLHQDVSMLIILC